MATQSRALWRRFERDPSDARAFQRLFRQLLREGDADAIVEAAATRAGHVDGEESLRLWVAIAERWAVEAGDAEARADATERAVEVAFEVDGAVEVIEALVQRADIPSATAAFWQRRLDQATDAPSRAEAALHVAEAAVRASDWDAALAAYAQAASEPAGVTEQVLRGLRAARDAGAPAAAIERQIEGILRKENDDRALFELLQRRLSATPSSDTATAVRLSRELASLALRTEGDLDEAVSFLTDAFEASPRSAAALLETLDELVDQAGEPTLASRQLELQLSEALGDLERVADSTAALIDAEATPQGRAERRLALADLLLASDDHFARGVEQLVAAADDWSAIRPEVIARLETLAEDESAADRRAKLEALLIGQLEEAEDWSALSNRLTDSLRREPAGETRVESALQLATIRADRLGDVDGAATLLGEVADNELSSGQLDRIIDQLGALERRGSAEAAETLDALLRASGRWADLARTLEARAASAGDEDATRARLLIDAARVWRDHAGEPARAAERLDDALAMRPDDQALLHEARAARAAIGDRAAARSLLERELQLAADGPERAALVIELAEALSEEGDRPAAVGLLAREAERHEEVSLKLGELLRDEQGASALDLAMARAIDAGDEAEAATLVWRAARALGLDTPEGIARGMERLGLGSLPAPQLDELSAAIEEHGNDDTQIQFLEILVERNRDDVSLLDALATRYAEAGRADDAAELRLELVEHEPDDAARWEDLFDALRTLDDPAKLATALEARLDHLDAFDGAPEEIQRLARRAFELRRDREPDSEAAIAAAERLLDVEPQATEAVGFLVERLEGGADARQIYDILRTSTGELRDPAVRAAREALLGQIAEEELADASLAAPHWTYVLHADEAVEEHRRHAASFLRGHYERTGRADRKIDVLRRSMELTVDPADVRSTGLDLAETLESTGQKTAAIEQFQELLEDDPEDPELLGRLAVAASTAGAYETAIDAFERWERALAGDEAAEADADGALAAGIPKDAQLLWAEARLEHAGAADDAAIERIAGLFEADPDDVDLLVFVATHLASPEAGSSLAHKLAERAREAPIEQRVRILYRAAELVAPYEEVGEQAAEFWQRILAEAPDERPAFDALQDHYRDRGDYDALVALYQPRVDALDDPLEQAELLRELAELAPDPVQAEGHLRAILAVLPEDLDAMRALLASLIDHEAERDDAAEEIAELLAASIKLEEDRETARDLRVEYAGRLRSDGALEEAVEQLEAVVEADPLDEVAVGELVALYGELEDDERLVAALERQAGLTSDEDERAQLLLRTAKLYEEALDQPGHAAETLSAVAEIFPRDITVLADIARLHEETESWDTALAALDRLASASLADDQRGETLRRAARIYEEEIGQDRKAFELLSRAVLLTPPDDDELDKLRRWAAELDAWGHIAELFRKLANAEEDEERRTALEREVAQIQREELKDPASAWRTLVASFERDPRVGATLDAIEELAADEEREGDLIDIYERLGNASPDDDDALWHALSRSARIAETIFERPDAAFDVILGGTKRPELRERAEEELERLAEAHDLWELHAKYLDDRWQIIEDEDEEVATLLRKARVEEEELDDWTAAFETLIGAMSAAPDHAEVRAEVYRLAREHNAWEFVLRLYELLQQEAESDEERIDYLLEMARIYDDEYDAPSRTLDQLLRAYQSGHRDDEIEDRLKTAALAAGRVEDLVSTWEWAAEESDDADEALAIWLSAARLSTDQELAEKAGAAWLEVLARSPRDDEAFDEALEAAETLGILEPLLEAIPQLYPEDTPRETVARRLVRKAAIAEERGEIDGAIDALEEAQSLTPDDLDIARSLRELQQQKGDWTAVADQLERELEQTDDADRLFEIYQELHRIREREIGDVDAAIATLKKAVSVLPDRATLHGQLVQQLQQHDRWRELADYLFQRAEEIEDPEEARELYYEAAAIAEEQLDDPRRALRIVDALLERDEDDVEACSLRARFLATLGRWHDHIGALVAISRSTSGRGSADALTQAATVYETKLFYRDRALETYREAVDAHPGHGDAWLALTRLVAEDAPEDDPSEAIEVCREAIAALEEYEGEARTRSTLLHRLALLLAKSDELDDPDEPVRLLERAVELDPHNVQARDEYAERARRRGGPKERLRVLSLELEDAETDRERAATLVRMASVRYFESDEASEALSTLEDADVLAPNHPGIIALRADISLSEAAWESAAASYERWLDELAPESLAGVAETPPLTPLESRGADSLCRYWCRYAFALEQMQRPAEARDAYAAANMEDDRDPLPYLGLARLAVDDGNAAAAKLHVSEFFDNVDRSDPSLEAKVRILAAEIALEEDDTDRALSHYEAAATIPGPHRYEAAQAATRLATIHAPPAQLAERLERLADVAESAAQRKETLLQLGDVYADQLGDADRAERAYRQALELDPDDPAVRERVLTASELAGSTEDALRGLDELLADAEDPRRIAELQIRRGKVLRQDSERLDEARDAFETALAHNPQSATALDLLVACYTESDDAWDLVAELEVFLARLREAAPGQTGHVRRRLGEVMLRELEMPDAARAVYEELRRDFPDDIPTLRALLDIYRDEEIAADEEALGVAADLVRLGHLSEEMLRALLELHLAGDAIDGALQTLVVLHLAGAASEEEVELLAALPQDVPEFEPGQLGDAFYQQYLRPLPLDEETAQLLATATEQLLESEETEVDELESPDKSAHAAIVAEWEAVREAFGYPEAVLLIDAEADVAARPLLRAPATVACSAALAETDDPRALRFELAYALCLCRPEFLAAATLGEMDLVGFLGAALAPMLPPEADEAADETVQQLVESWQERIGLVEVPTGLTPRTREELPSGPTLRQLAAQTAARAGLVSCFQSTIAFERLCSRRGASRPTSVAELHHLGMEDSAIRGLIAFILSERYLEARRALGLLVRPVDATPDDADEVDEEERLEAIAEDIEDSYEEHDESGDFDEDGDQDEDGDDEDSLDDFFDEDDEDEDSDDEDSFDDEDEDGDDEGSFDDEDEDSLDDFFDEDDDAEESFDEDEDSDDEDSFDDGEDDGGEDPDRTPVV